MCWHMPTAEARHPGPRACLHRAGDKGRAAPVLAPWLRLQSAGMTNAESLLLLVSETRVNKRLNCGALFGAYATSALRLPGLPRKQTPNLAAKAMARRRSVRERNCHDRDDGLDGRRRFRGSWAGGWRGACRSILCGPADELWRHLGSARRRLPGPRVQGFKGTAKKTVLLPGARWGLGGRAARPGRWRTRANRAAPPTCSSGGLASSLPARHLPPRRSRGTAGTGRHGLGFGRLQVHALSRAASNDATGSRAVSSLPGGVDATRVITTVEAVWFARDLINTPAVGSGACAARGSSPQPGCASRRPRQGDQRRRPAGPQLPHDPRRGPRHPREPRLIDLTWGPRTARKVTLVGKGITFDTGGLDIKPSSAMLLMKKDMGGAATALSCRAHDHVRAARLPPAVSAASGGEFHRWAMHSARATF